MLILSFVTIVWQTYNKKSIHKYVFGIFLLKRGNYFPGLQEGKREILRNVEKWGICNSSTIKNITLIVCNIFCHFSGAKWFIIFSKQNYP